MTTEDTEETEVRITIKASSWTKMVRERDEALARVELIKPHKNNLVAEYFSSSNTPETDAQVTTFSSISKFKKRFLCSTGKVSAQFARKLERERDEAREDARLLAERLTRLELDSSLALAKLERERNELKKALEGAK